MGNSISAAAVPALCAAISALELLGPQRIAAGTTTTTTTAAAHQAPALGHAIWPFLLPLAAVGGLLTSVSLIYNHLHRAVADAGAARINRRLPELLKLMLCTSVGLLHFFLFILQAPALGLAATRYLPAVATATYFLGVLLIIVGHIRAGGEGGGGGAVVVAGGPIEGPVGVGLLLLTKMATAALLCLMFKAICVM
ncbi:hypothetical protein HU200_000123 [Digitaria exilis]|uniref:Uncharacterized protein n=1 Tax=Digitaria exilis TaxID=1010633 RepID=A0A835KX24_9POAL|nr:hypothetical protein HU200_000123 [Digitaria exilis]